MSDFFSRPFTFDRVARMAVCAIALMCVFLLVRYLTPVLLPLFIAWLLAYLFQPMVDFLTGYVRLRKVAIFMVMLSIILVILGFFCFMVPTFANELLRLKDILDSTGVLEQSLIPKQWVDYLSQFIGDINLGKMLTPEGLFKLAVGVVPHLESVASSAVSVVMFLVELVFVLIYLYFILRDQDNMANALVRLMPSRYKELGISLLRDLKTGMSVYYRRQALVACVDAVLFSIGFSLIGMPMSVVMGVLLGALNMVPYLQYLGLPPAAVLMIISATEQGDNIGVALLLLLAVFVVVQIIQDLYLIPKLMGKSMGMNPVVVLLSLSVWGYLLGIIGMIIALPVTTILISYYKHYVLNEVTERPFAEDEKLMAKKSE